ncbi:MAG: BBP7 family outer membrane beta-barrel protein [Pirellulales bacterium]|nr:BBP7 family outer membrane beta-barrel protein [Pirellulales bacterium]
MTFRSLHKWIAALGLAASSGLAPSAWAQAQDAYCGPACDFETQWFAPVDFDFNCRPIEKECGFFFNYNRLVWAMTGERTTIGARGVTDLSEVIYYGETVDLNGGGTNPFANGDPPPPYLIQNGIQEAPPDADLGWGTRYEVGYQSGGRSWMVGVLDGPVSSTYKVYGFQHLAYPNSFPAWNDLPLLANDLLGTTGFSIEEFDFTGGGFGVQAPHSGTAAIPTTANGFGSVHVNFENNDQHLFGFRDYVNDVLGTLGGPGVRVVGIAVENGIITELEVLAGGDLLIDDLNGNAINGFIFIVDPVTDAIIGLLTDWGDLARFNVAFDTMAVRNTTRTDGVEVMHTWDIDTSHLPVKEQRNSFQFGIGARFFKMKDTFYWDGRGSILGRTYQETIADNQIVGPQIRAAWNQQHKRWSMGVDARCLLGYNVTDIGQTAAFGENLAPGQPNSLLYTQPTFSTAGKQHNEFSPLVEVRAEARYQVTSALALKLGYTGIFVDNVTRASEVVVYRIPDMGIRGGGDQEVFINGVDFGFELVH